MEHMKTATNGISVAAILAGVAHALPDAVTVVSGLLAGAWYILQFWVYFRKKRRS
jgi:hypothetical protein